MDFTGNLKRIILSAILVSCVGGQAYAAVSAKIVPTIPANGANSFYTGNRAPLKQSPLIKLPIGAIRPEGWLRQQMVLMTDGFTGRLPELSEFCQFEGNAWVSPKGEGKYGWEEVPYWLKGYGDLGYVLGDKRIIDETEKWINGMLSNQRPDGYFGPEANREGYDLWPNMPALHSLRSYYEYTGDKRVLAVMSKYFKWQTTVPFEKLLPPFWQKIRGGDNLDSIYWLYNRTGEKWLLDAARVIHERTADWTGNVANWHGVNIGQAFREPAQYYQQTHDARYLKAAERNYNEVIGKYGQVPGGGFGADENCREGYFGPRQATETCTWAELMYSHELLAGITGNPLWLDRCEEIAFNSLPASMTPDLKGLHYLTAPNQIQLDHADKSPMIQNAGDMFSYNPYGYRCCQHNVAMAWPYYAEHLWMATPGNGLAAALYAESKISAKVGKGIKVNITETTKYPFDETIQFKISTPEKVQFPLYLRIPGWCSSPKVSLRDNKIPLPAAAKGWIMINRVWENGDRIELKLPMDIKVRVWDRNRNSASIYRGPLIYSLKIGERWERFGGTDKWPGYEVFPATPWNYGLVLDKNNPESSIQLAGKKSSLALQPFTPENAPIELKATAKRIPEWKQEANGLVGEVQHSPVLSKEPLEEITLIPMGCARLRISAFPQAGDGPDAMDWGAKSETASASHVFDTILALNDKQIPKNSSEQYVPRFTWWDHRGTNEWVQYTFGAARKVSYCEVMWFDDTPLGGACKVPASWRVLWWDGSKWQPAKNKTAYGTKINMMNRVEFEPVTTNMLRLDVNLQPNLSGGILEWQVGN